MKVKVTVKIPEVRYPIESPGPFGDGIYTTKKGSVLIENGQQQVLILSDGSVPYGRVGAAWWRKLPDDTIITLRLRHPPQVELPKATVGAGEPLGDGLYSGDAGENVLIHFGAPLVIRATGEMDTVLTPGQRLTEYPEGTSLTLEYA